MENEKKTDNSRHHSFKAYNLIYEINHFTINGKREQFGLSEKAVYCYLLHWQDYGRWGEAKPSNARMVKDLGITKPTLKRITDHLEKIGLITVKRGVGVNNGYTSLNVDEVLSLDFHSTSDSQWKGTRHEQPSDATQNLAVQPAPGPTEIPGGSPEEPKEDPDYFTRWDDVDPTTLEPATKPPTATLNDIREFAYQHKGEFRGSCINVQRLIDVYETATGRVFNRQHHAALVNDGQLERYLSDDGDIYDYATSSDDIVF
ncbi:Uncharacterised protein [Serratia quinivorans]|uniref:helix-turn-helix domain-containing protein n=1 Tax=Serratia quinivorans TaxID=137545 RepID=UPI0021799215|nr:helix-turn-helix domain-containing protein [Serratia quinivorans]CAI1081861.1 Uncharacterised protein [Serratia quinivorans]